MNKWKIESNLKTHGFTFAVKAEYNRLKAAGVSKVYRINLAVQNVKQVKAEGLSARQVVKTNA